MSAETTPEQAFAASLAEFQESLPNVSKGNTATVKSDKGNYSYSYADLTDITDAAVPLLAKCGLAWTARPTFTDHGFVLRYALVHRLGHREEGDFPLPDPAKTTPQQIGSYLTYARRYALCAVTGIAPGGDDDDGEKANEARAADPLPRAPRRPNATTRSGAPDDPSQVTDEWTTATDLEWLEDARQRLLVAASAAEVEAIVVAARRKLSEGRLSSEDAAAFKGETDQRLAELRGELVAP